jgi:L-ascorbate 6-phosphate lactonase
MNRQAVFDFQVKLGSTALWWLGQSSFLLKSPGGVTLALDPYLTNYCKQVGKSAGLDFDRRTLPPLQPADLVGISAYVMTHKHEDHLDPLTLDGYRKAGGAGPYVAPPETIEALEGLGVPREQLKMIWPNKSYTFGDVELRATFAIPLGSDDMTHVGYVVKLKGGPVVYFTGDTRWHDVLIDCVLPHKPDVLVAVINPFGNLSPEQAARLAKGIDAKVVIPSHYDLFPDNSLPPRLLRTNLMFLGIADRYREMNQAEPFVFPESSVRT